MSLTNFTGILFYALLASSLLAQSSINTGNAKAVGTCSISHVGNNDTFIIKNCGIGEVQGQKIIELLNQILSNSDQGKKIDEVLEFIRRASPYKGVQTYSPNGSLRVHVASSNTEILEQGAQLENIAIEEAIESENWSKVVSLSSNAISKFPGWFSAFYYLGLANSIRNGTLLDYPFDKPLKTRGLKSLPTQTRPML